MSLYNYLLLIYWCNENKEKFSDWLSKLSSQFNTLNSWFIKLAGWHIKLVGWLIIFVCRLIKFVGAFKNCQAKPNDENKDDPKTEKKYDMRSNTIRPRDKLNQTFEI